MTASIKPLIKRPAWKALAAHYKKIKDVPLSKLFSDDAKRGQRLTVEAAGLFLDYSKNRITDETLQLLVQLADESDLRGRIAAMFSGEKINITEKRAVLHVALRAPEGASILVDGENVVPEVHAVLEAMSAFANRVRSGAWKGHTGKRIRNIVNIGIGGSDLGPVMAYEALRHYSERGLTFRFVSNVDGADFVEATQDLDPAETLFIVSSKTFTTLETMTNAESARDWLLKGLGGNAKAVAKHFVAVSTNAEKVAEFGIDTANMFDFWDWVGGRYSMDSAIGLSTMLAIGPENFRAMLAGFHEMDEHFRTAPLREEPACAHGPLFVWNTDFLRRGDGRSATVRAIPQALSGVSAAVDDGEQRQACDRSTGIGELCNWSHLLGRAGHERSALVLSAHSPRHAADSLRLYRLRQGAHSAWPAPRHAPRRMCSHKPRRWPLARRPSRSAEGTPDWLVPHRCLKESPVEHNSRRAAHPRHVGKLVAIYEHCVFMQGVIWDINPFDQWGVELGKALAKRIIPELERTPRRSSA